MGEVSLNNFGNLVPAFNASAIVDTANDSSNPLDREVSSWNKAQQITSHEASTKLQMFKTHNAAATVNGVEFPNKKPRPEIKIIGRRTTRCQDFQIPPLIIRNSGDGTSNRRRIQGIDSSEGQS